MFAIQREKGIPVNQILLFTEEESSSGGTPLPNTAPLYNTEGELLYPKMTLIIHFSSRVSPVFLRCGSFRLLQIQAWTTKETYNHNDGSDLLFCAKRQPIVLLVEICQREYMILLYRIVVEDISEGEYDVPETYSLPIIFPALSDPLLARTRPVDENVAPPIQIDVQPNVRVRLSPPRVIIYGVTYPLNEILEVFFEGDGISTNGNIRGWSVPDVNPTS